MASALALETLYKLGICGIIKRLQQKSGCGYSIHWGNLAVRRSDRVPASGFLGTARTTKARAHNLYQ